MSQTNWPLSSLPILKLDDVGAKQACELFYTTQYRIIWGLPMVHSFSFLSDTEYLTLSTHLLLVTNKRKMSIRQNPLYLTLRTIQYNETVMEQ